MNDKLMRCNESPGLIILQFAFVNELCYNYIDIIHNKEVFV